jgi:hypothetical protein
MAIHDVEMKPIGARFFDAMDFRFKVRKIRGENGWSGENARHWARVLSFKF